jgi:hypothetical protein
MLALRPTPKPLATPLVGCPRLLIQFIHSYPPYLRPFLHPQPEDAPCRFDRDPHSWNKDTYIYVNIKLYIRGKFVAGDGKDLEALDNTAVIITCYICYSVKVLFL